MITLTIDNLLKCTSPIIYRNKEYISASQIVEPVIKALRPHKPTYSITIKQPDIEPETVNGDIDYSKLTFTRLLLECTFGSIKHTSYKYKLCIAYGLDTRKPIVKIYIGVANPALDNFVTITASNINLQELHPQATLDYSFVTELLKRMDTLGSELSKLQATEFSSLSTSCTNEALGRWIRQASELSYKTSLGITKISVTDIIKAHNDLFVDTGSNFYVDKPTNFLHIFEAFSCIISAGKAKDMLNVYEKTLVLANILNVRNL